MNLFRVFLVAAWCAVVFVTVQAFGQQGMIAGDVFFADIRALGWRAQFNVDFMAHLLLVWLWVAWRHRFSLPGILLGFLCVMGGAAASFLYVLVLSVLVKGDMHELLLGARAEAGT